MPSSRIARHLGCCQWAAEVVPLAAAAAQGEQVNGLVCRLDAFKDRFHAGRLDQSVHRVDEPALPRVRADVPDKAAVHLYAVDRQAAEVADGGISGTEVVDLSSDAERLQGPERVHFHVPAGDEGTLGDLDDEARRRDSGFRQRLADVVHQVQTLEFHRREVHAHFEVVGKQRFPLPLRYRFQRRPQHPAAEFQNDARLFGNRDEVVRHNEPAGGVLPADERLHSGHPAGGKVHYGLVVQEQLVASDSLPQFGSHVPAQLAGVQHDRLEDLVLAPPGLFCRVHGGVRPHQHAFCSFTLGGAVHPDAGAGPHFQFFHPDAGTEGFLDPVSRAESGGEAAGRKQDGEFVAAQPGNCGAIPGGGTDPPGHLDEHLVPNLVAESVVDVLKVVQINHQHGRTLRCARRKDGRDLLHKGGTVGGTGQAVRQRHFAHLKVGGLQFPGARFHPVLEFLVNRIELFGQEVDTGDDGVHVITGRGGADPGGQVAGRDADDPVN